MQKLVNYDVIIDIDLIENITGANQYFEVFFSTKEKIRYKIVLEWVWDMRYSIENANIDRFHEFRTCLPEGLIDNGTFIVEDSEYIKYFEQQVMGTMPIDKLKHYIFYDTVDSVIDVLTEKKPIIIKI